MTLESHTQNMHIWIRPLSGNIHLIETIISQTITTAVTVTPDGGSHPHVTWGPCVTWWHCAPELHCELYRLLCARELCTGWRSNTDWHAAGQADHPVLPVTTGQSLGRTWAKCRGRGMSCLHRPALTDQGSTQTLLSSLPNLKTEYEMKMYMETMETSMPCMDKTVYRGIVTQLEVT